MNQDHVEGSWLQRMGKVTQLWGKRDQLPGHFQDASRHDERIGEKAGHHLASQQSQPLSSVSA